ncbi:MerR family transcriptional regulator [Sporosarcina cascadiensis]|uniref:MerR family transcriptional regulator n=1 Tax=Sporosarcina cascadiensis TaxID=2660747 RepID=UPI00129BF06E|nr:MerR family transcriptional regulator [Sporosarcina cascadiensis]
MYNVRYLELNGKKYSISVSTERLIAVKPSSETPSYTIKQVADQTGLSRQVLRKWEERYDIVVPQRLENGYRVYREEDIRLYLLMKRYAEDGFALAQASEMAKSQQHSDFSSEPAESYTDQALQELLRHGKKCDELELNFSLLAAYHRLGLERYLKQIVIPFLKKVGDNWATGEWDEYQEALSSLVVRDQLVQLRRNFQYRNDAPLILGACLPNESHEIPVHIILLQLMLKGWRTAMIGASPAPGAIQSFTESIKPAKVLLSASTTTPFEENPMLMKELDDFAGKHPDTEFYLGGYGAHIWADQLEMKYIRLLESIDNI